MLDRRAELDVLGGRAWGTCWVDMLGRHAGETVCTELCFVSAGLLYWAIHGAVTPRRTCLVTFDRSWSWLVALLLLALLVWLGNRDRGVIVCVCCGRCGFGYVGMGGGAAVWVG